MEEVFRPFLHWPLPVEFPWGKYCWHGYQCKEKHLSDPPWSYTLRIPAGSFPQNPEIHGSYQDQIPEHLWWSNLLPEDLTQDKFLRFPLNIPNVLQSVCLIHNRQTAPPVHHRGCRLQYILFFHCLLSPLVLTHSSLQEAAHRQAVLRILLSLSLLVFSAFV